MSWVLFYDGNCGLCNRSVQRLIRWDREGLIHYAPLQGELADQHQLRSYLKGDEASMVLLNEEDGSIRTQSDSLLQILRLLGGPWRLLLVFGLVPRRLRDGIYRCLARNRHRFFHDDKCSCDLPDEKRMRRMRR